MVVLHSGWLSCISCWNDLSRNERTCKSAFSGPLVRFIYAIRTDSLDVAEKDLILLVRHEHFGHRLHVSRLVDREKMAKKKGFRFIGGGKNTKLVEYDVSASSFLRIDLTIQGYTNLGNEFERVVQALKDEQSRLYKALKLKVSGNRATQLTTACRGG
jgi:hypothetical protein